MSSKSTLVAIAAAGVICALVVEWVRKRFAAAEEAVYRAAVAVEKELADDAEKRAEEAKKLAADAAEKLFAAGAARIEAGAKADLEARAAWERYVETRKLGGAPETEMETLDGLREVLFRGRTSA